MSRILAIANVKGGVGKTATTGNLSAALAARGRRVLAVDLDPQCGLTVSLGYEPDELPGTVYDVLNSASVPLRSALVTTPEHFDLAPAHHDLLLLERKLSGNSPRVDALRAALAPIREQYDYILVDCAASAGILIGNTLAASDEVLIPFVPNYLSLRSLDWFLQIIYEMQKQLAANLHVTGLFLSMYEPWQEHAEEIVAKVKDLYGPAVPFFTASLPPSATLKIASEAGQSVLRYAPQSVAALAFRSLAQEVEEGIPPAPKAEEQGQAPLVRRFKASKPGGQGTRRGWRDTWQENGSEEIHLARQAVSGGDMAAAYRQYSRATRSNPGLAPAWVGRAQTSADWTESVWCLAEALTIEPFNGEARSQLRLLLDKRLPGARAEETPILIRTAQRLAAKNLASEAEQVYKRVLELDPQCGEAWVGLGRVASDPQAALQAYQRVLQLDPENGEARTELEAARTRARAGATSLIYEATTLMRAGSKDKAHELFLRAIELDPGSDQAYVGAARTCSDLESGLPYVDRALEINPENDEAREFRAWLERFQAPPEPPRRTIRDFLRRLIVPGFLIVSVVLAISVLVR